MLYFLLGVNLINTQLINVERKYITKVHKKENKTPIQWSSKIPKQYKRNTFTTDFNFIKRLVE